MITTTPDIQVQRGGVQSENVFTIKASAKAFSILSDGLYSDKIKAIVRELSCNGHDSHVAAGKADTPIEVKLPTYLDHTFYVKDFGLGLSHKDVTQLYTTYFESTKTDSDDYIGQLGLGSKSPFSYASTFTVESRFEGMKRVYTCFKNEQGMPAISLMGEEDTNEINGVTVSLAVKHADIEKFNEAARKVFMYFTPTPIITGQRDWAPYKINHTVTGTNWRVRNTDYYARMEKAYVIQGVVAYPVDVNILIERGMSSAAKKLANTNIDLYVDIGNVEVAASREALSYDTRTIQNLIDVMEAAAKEMRTSFQNEFDTCETAWDVAQLAGKFSDSGSIEFREIYNSMHTVTPFTWNGGDVSRKVELNLDGIQHTTIRRMSQTRSKISTDGTWTPVNVTKLMWYDVGYQNLHVLVDTEAKGHTQLAEFFLRDQSSVNGHRPVVLIIAPTSKKLFDQKEVDKIIRQLGDPTVVTTSDISFTRTKVGTYKKRDVEQKLVWTGFPDRANKRGGDTFSRLCWSTETVDLSDGGFYVNVERFTAINSKNATIFRLDLLISVGRNLGLVNDDFKLYGMNERDRKHIVGNANWVEFTGYVADEFVALNVNDTLYKRCIYESVVNQLGRNFKRVFVDNWGLRRRSLQEGEFTNFFDDLLKLDEEAATVSTALVHTAIQLLHLNVNTEIAAAELYNKWRVVIDQYEMLSMLDWDCVDSNSVDKITKYVNTIETAKLQTSEGDCPV